MTKNPVEIQTDDVYIQSKIDKVFLKDLIFSFETIHLPAYKPIYCTKKSLEGIIEKGGSISLALFKQKTIIGLAILDYPDEKVLWAHSNRESIMELKAVEVLREFRNRGIARQLMVRLFSDSFVEEKIIYLTAYSWIWDLAYSGFTIQSYRDMLISLYSPFGFTVLKTNEPNICLKSENIFMVRIGRKVPRKIQDDFKLLRFGIIS